jgi:DNA-directed RNA polymerase specialized sigma24 family protein
MVAAVKLMAQRTQAVFVLYHFEQKTHVELARTLGIAVRTVEDHMARANDHLLAAMGREP